ncbi:sulfite exporter TauE/SafE family protein [Falsibacillus pallidus]|uniref:Probable membrane transporter protein n=1 Tax=Falsibacillus pallidus TaxID=493781 RepID=A0A370G0Y4_9BACI|nr:sulfite exporter TauE/SafE family protein [Falsibacillus pallidus]RDI36656.1 hypothetical protein DFR59_12710 [Falsibacillus pallidus]
MMYIGLAVLGFIASIYGTIIGAGGGFIIVPFLLMLTDLSPATAAATGLALVFFNASTSIFAFIKQKRILLYTGLIISLGAIPGTFIGSWLVVRSPEHVFKIVFAVTLIGLGAFLLWKNFRKADKSSDAQKTEHDIHEMSWGYGIKIGLVGILLGTISSFFGIGGGWLLVPILVYGFGVSVHYATATSIFSLAIYSGIGLIQPIIHGRVDWAVAAFCGIGVLIGGQAGALVSSKISGGTITKLLAFIVIIIGIKLMFT